MANVYEMVYKQGWCEPQVLAHDIYHGRNYYVVSFGTHPCAYIDLSDLLNMTRKEREYIENTIECHGGVTYSSAELVVSNTKGWYIGWDYAHCMDYVGFMPYIDELASKKWTTPEMVHECKKVIDQIAEMVNELTKEE